MPARDLALALLVVAIWGLNFVGIRLGLAGMPPMLLVAVRFALSAFPALLLVRRPQIPWRHLIFYGLFMGVGQAGLLYAGIKAGMPAGLASIVAQSQAFFTMGLAALLLGERIRAHNVLGACVAACGLALVALRFDAPVPLAGLLMVIGAAFSWGCGNVLTRHIGKVDPLSLSVWSSLVPPLPMLALSLLLEGPDAPRAALAAMSPTTLIATAYTAYLSTILCYALWTRLISAHGAGRIAPFTMLVPFFGVTSTALVFGEVITPLTLVAGGLIISGLAINVFGGRVQAVRAGS